LQTDEIEKELKKILQNFSENKTKIANNTNYPLQIVDPKMSESNENNALEMKIYVDGSRTDNKSYYRIVRTDELVIKKETIEELLVNHSLSEREKYQLDLIKESSYNA